MTKDSREKQIGIAQRAMVLAAGKGTRLHPLTEELPKPLVPICNQPAIAHVFSKLRAAGIEETVVNGWHLGEVLEEAVGNLLVGSLDLGFL